MTATGLHVLMIPSMFPTPVWPEGTIFYRDQAKALAAYGHQVGVVFPELRSLRKPRLGSVRVNHFQVTHESQGGVDVLIQHGWNIPNARVRRLMFVRLAEKLVRRYTERWGRPDILHAQGVLWGGVAAGVIAERLQVPFVITEHSSRFLGGDAPPGWQERAIRAAYRPAGRVLAVSQVLADAITPLAGRSPSVVPNLVDTEYFKPHPGHVHGHEGTRFLAVGALIPVKDFERLIRCFHRVSMNVDGCSLDIAGEGPQRTTLQRQVEALGMGERVQLAGQLSRDAVRERLWASDVLVSTSRTETFGVAIVEALASGVPAIVVDSGGPREFMAGSEWLIPQGSDDALTDAMLRAALDPLMIRAGQASLCKEVRTRYGAEAVAAQITHQYEGALADA